MLIVATRGCRHGSILYGTVVLDSRPRSRGCYPYGEASGHLGYVLTAGKSACPAIPRLRSRMLVGASISRGSAAVRVTREVTRAGRKPSSWKQPLDS